MPRITSLNILLNTQEGYDYLSELYGRVIQNIMKSLVSTGLKNQDLSGDPKSGSVEVKRFANAQPKDYGTARAAGKGDAVKAEPITVSINKDKEIVEEIEEKDTVWTALLIGGRIIMSYRWRPCWTMSFSGSRRRTRGKWKSTWTTP